MIIHNKNGVNLDFGCVAGFMDKDLEKASYCSGWSFQSTFRLYCEAHFNRYGKEFIFDKLEKKDEDLKKRYPNIRKLEKKRITNQRLGVKMEEYEKRFLSR